MSLYCISTVGVVKTLGRVCHGYALLDQLYTFVRILEGSLKFAQQVYMRLVVMKELDFFFFVFFGGCALHWSFMNVIMMSCPHLVCCHCQWYLLTLHIRVL